MTAQQGQFSQFVDDNFNTAFGDEAKSSSAVICLAGQGNLVVFVSDTFEAHTGYSPAETMGRNLSFLQGPETEPEAVEHFRHLIKNGLAGSVRITNYKKDGTRFVHDCEFRPIFDDSAALTHFIAVQRPI